MARPLRRSRPLVLHLIILCAAILLPAYAFMAVLLTQYTRSARVEAERAALEDARDLGEAIDYDIAALNAVLQTLSFAAPTDRGDLEHFYRLATRVADATGHAVVLSDPRGRQVINTRRPFGSTLPPLGNTYDSVFLKRKPLVTNLLKGTITQMSAYAVTAPVLDEERKNVPYAVSFGIDSSRIRDILVRANLQRGAIAAVIDADGRLLARSVGHERLVGSDWSVYLKQADTRQEGQFRHVNLEREEMVVSFTRINSAGWLVTHSTPVAAFDAPVVALIRELLALAGLAAVVAAGGGYILARRILGALRSLDDAATAVGRGGDVPSVRTSVVEIDRVGERLTAAARALQLTTVAKDALLYEVNHRVKNSLAVVTSLLAMQVRQTDDERARRGLEDLRTRIDVIASVHQRLYQSGRHDRLDLGAFLQEIATDMAIALGGERLRLVCQCEAGIVIGVDRTTPLALIVGELLTNAVKHGARGAACEITLGVRRINQGRILVSVADDGPGLPKIIAPGHTSGIGMRIVTGLVRQIRGQMSSNPGETGARFEIILDEAAPWTTIS